MFHQLLMPAAGSLVLSFDVAALSIAAVLVVLLGVPRRPAWPASPWREDASRHRPGKAALGATVRRGGDHFGRNPYPADARATATALRWARRGIAPAASRRPERHTPPGAPPAPSPRRSPPPSIQGDVQ